MKLFILALLTLTMNALAVSGEGYQVDPDIDYNNPPDYVRWELLDACDSEYYDEEILQAHVDNGFDINIHHNAIGSVQRTSPRRRLPFLHSIEAFYYPTINEMPLDCLRFFKPYINSPNSLERYYHSHESFMSNPVTSYLRQMSAYFQNDLEGEERIQNLKEREGHFQLIEFLVKEMGIKIDYLAPYFGANSTSSDVISTCIAVDCNKSEFEKLVKLGANVCLDKQGNRTFARNVALAGGKNAIEVRDYIFELTDQCDEKSGQ